MRRSRKRLGWIVVVAGLAASMLAGAADRPPEAWSFQPKPITGGYQVYGGTLSEVQPPSSKNRKVSLVLEGTLAKELFEQIGPDRKKACGAASGHRVRLKGDLACIRNKRDGYACYLGIDERTGKSTRGAGC